MSKKYYASILLSFCAASSAQTVSRTQWLQDNPQRAHSSRAKCEDQAKIDSAVLGVIKCQQTSTISPKPSPSPSPAPTPSSTPTPTPVPSPSPLPSPSSSPSPQPTTAPTLPPVSGAQGPTLVSPKTVAIQGSGKTYNVSTDAELIAVPWASLTAGDVVNINHKATPYKVKFGIRGTGTAQAPITVNGVTDANGNRPVFDFNGATTAPAPGVFSSTPAYGESLGGIVILRGQGDDYNSYKPRHIKIANLELRNANRGASYTAQNGSVQKGLGAAIYILRGADITLENLVITNCSFGLFTMAKGETMLEAAERVTLRNSWFKDNGIPGSFLEHGVYMQADSPVVEGNYFGKVISGSEGSSFKDRSAKLVFRNNYVVSSSRAIDLVHSEEQSNGIAARPYYGIDYVYNNTIINDSAYEAIHFGGDNMGEQEGDPAVFAPPLKYRSTLYFWGNNVKHTVGGYRNIAFGLSLKDTATHAWNNTIEFGTQATTHYWVEYAGKLTLYNSNKVTGKVQASGRDGSVASHINILNVPLPQPDNFVAP